MKRIIISIVIVAVILCLINSTVYYKRRSDTQQVILRELLRHDRKYVGDTLSHTEEFNMYQRYVNCGDVILDI